MTLNWQYQISKAIGNNSIVLFSAVTRGMLGGYKTPTTEPFANISTAYFVTQQGPKHTYGNTLIVKGIKYH